MDRFLTDPFFKRVYMEPRQLRTDEQQIEQFERRERPERQRGCANSRAPVTGSESAERRAATT